MAICGLEGDDSVAVSHKVNEIAAGQLERHLAPLPRPHARAYRGTRGYRLAEERLHSEIM